MDPSGLFNDTFAVSRQSTPNSQDTIGGLSTSWANVSTNNPCRSRLLTARERETLAREGVNSTHRHYCGPSVDVTTKDRIILTSTTETFDVTYVNDVDQAGEFLQIDMRLRE